MKRICAGFVLALLSGAAAPAGTPSAPPAAPAEPGPRVLARVNGEALYAEDVESLLGEIHSQAQAADRARYDDEQILFRLVNDALLAQEARRIELDKTSGIRERLARARAARARERIYREEIASHIAISDEAVRAVYDDVFRTATLTMLTRRDADEAKALREDVLAADGDEALAALARARSEDPYALRGGRIESAPLVDLYETMLAFATTAAPGEVSPPTITPFGWSILRLERLEPADPALADKRRGKCIAVLRFRREQELRAALAPRWSERFPVSIDREALAAIEVQKMHDGRLVPKVDRPDRVVLRVGERSVTSARLGSALTGAWENVGNPLVAERIRQIVVDDVVFNELLAAEAERRGYASTPEVDREMHALENRLLVQRYLQESVAGEVAVSKDEMQAYYETHRDEFRRPPKLHVLQLTTASEEGARRAIDLARGGADFAWLVSQHSIDDFRERGGDRGWVAANAGLPLFRDELATAKAGDLFGPKAWDGAWVVVKVDVVEDQGVYGFDEVSGNVKARLVDQRLDERVETTIRKLRERSEIWVADNAAELLEAAPVRAVPGAEPRGHAGH